MREYGATSRGINVAGALKEVGEGGRGRGDIVEDCAADVAVEEGLVFYAEFQMGKLTRLGRFACCLSGGTAKYFW